MKLTAMIFLTVDGVYQGPGGPDEDRRGGFERGGWLAPYANEETWRFITSVQSTGGPCDLRDRRLRAQRLGAARH